MTTGTRLPWELVRHTSKPPLFHVLAGMFCLGVEATQRGQWRRWIDTLRGERGMSGETDSIESAQVAAESALLVELRRAIDALTREPLPPCRICGARDGHPHNPAVCR